MRSNEKRLVSQHYQVTGLTKAILDRFYDGSFVNGTARFYDLIRGAEIGSGLFLDLGCGTGQTEKDADRDLSRLPCRRVGLDVDADLAHNPVLDARALGAAESIPFADNSFLLVLADCVMEHITHPEAVTREVHRVLKPGGYFFFRTGNLYHYSMIASQLTPHVWHKRFVRKITRTEGDLHEPYPTVYRFNTRRRMASCLSAAGFSHITLRVIESEPSYLVFHWLPLLVGVAYERLVNSASMFSFARAVILGACRK